MSATLAAPATLDVSGTAPIPFTRLLKVELRKMMDTRASRWLVISIAIASALVMAIQLLIVVLNDLKVGAWAFVTSMSIPVGILLPVIAITLVTSEWNQRTGLVTFTQVPHRGRVLQAKFAAVLLLAVAATVVGGLFGSLGNVLYGAFSGETVVWNVTVPDLLGILLSQALGMAMAFAFAMLFTNTAGSIVSFFVVALVLPLMVYSTLQAIFPSFGDAVVWFDFTNASFPLTDDTPMRAADWVHTLVTSLEWIVLPFALGATRVLKAEVK